MSKEANAIDRAAGQDIGPVAATARYQSETKKIEIECGNGVTLSVPVRLIEGLEFARADELAEIEVSATGRILRFPKLNADIGVPALLDGMFGTRVWMRQLGSQKSPAKTAAARENGKKGGRPRRLGPRHSSGL
jgi:hypothetical protein